MSEIVTLTGGRHWHDCKQWLKKTCSM